MLVGAIEAGGTKFVCAVGSGPGEGLLARAAFPTGSDPQRVLDAVVEWLKEQEGRHGQLRALGVASFGPVDLDRRSSTSGFITSTPQPGWRSTDVLGPLRRAFPGAPIGFDTDVNGAALGEHTWGRAVGINNFVYITIGTGIGAGGMARGKLLHGLVHPEMGHILLPAIAGDSFEGACPFHGRCWEGLCSGPALLKRTGIAAESLSPDDPAWDLEARYIALALSTIVYVLSPRKIILGGSVRKAGRLGEARFFNAIQARLVETLNGYITSPALTADGVCDYVVPPLLGDDAGVLGAIALAQHALSAANERGDAQR
jgi:fructokinase